MCYICGQYGLAYGDDQTFALSDGAVPLAAVTPTVVRDYTALFSEDGGNGWNGQGGATAGSPVIVTYSFETSAYSYLVDQGYTAAFSTSFFPLDSAERARAVEALGMWDAASGISFVEVPAGQGSIRFGKYNFNYDAVHSWASGFAYHPARGYQNNGFPYSWDSDIGGDVFLNTTRADVLAGVHIYLHEIGHALGFKHPFDGTRTLATDLDTIAQTVMSYTGARATALGPLDLQAAVYRYGALDHANTTSWNWNAASLLLTQIGTGLAERIMGVSVRDSLAGGGGNDTLAGFAGADTMFGDAGNDSLFGGIGNDSLDGGIGNDTVAGEDGNDVLKGGAGDDSLQGDAGDDLFLSDAGADRFYGGLGVDTVSYANATAGIVFDCWSQTNNAGAAAGDTIPYSADIEAFIGSPFADVIRLGLFNKVNGGAGNDSLYGDGWYANNETLDGGTGADSMTGHAGADLYYVDHAGDVVMEAAYSGTDTVITSVSYALTTGQSVEVLKTALASGVTALDLTGNDVAQAIYGNAGSNRINGLGGADTMTGYGGSDVYTVDHAGDKVIEAAGGGTDTVRSMAAAYTLSTGQSVEAMTIANAAATAAANLTGNALAQSLTGSAGANLLNGAGGADTMIGLGGNDTFYIDDAGDRVTDAVGGGSDTVRTTLLNTVLTAGQEIEVLQTTNAALTTAIQLTGNNYAQRIFGNAGANVLDGKLGADQMTGGAGRDAFVFSTTLGASNIDRIIDFVAGTDSIRLENAVFTALGAAGALAAGAFHVGAAAHDATDRIIYNATYGTLAYDSDGTGAAAAVRFATLGTGLVLTAADFMVI